MNTNWTVKTKHKKTDQLDQRGKPVMAVSAQLLFKGQVVHHVDGVTAESTLQEQADQWNADNYEPNMEAVGIVCPADLSTQGQRDKLMKKWAEEDKETAQLI